MLPSIRKIMKKKKRKKVEKKITFKVDEVCCDTVSLEESQEASHFFFFGCDSKVVEKTKEREGLQWRREGKGRDFDEEGVSWKWRLGEIPRK